MDTSKKIIRGIVNSRGFTITSAITQWDYGWQFIPEIEDLPATYRLDFSNEEKRGTALPVYCSTDGAEVPTELIDTGKDIWVWYVAIGEGYGITEYKWRIPNKCKPKTEEDEPTPTQQSSIDQLIVRSNEAVESAEQSAQSASADAERAEEARTDAQNYATQAEQSTADAHESASQASASATASAQSASQSAQIKSDIEGMVEDAQGYADSASQSATASANSAISAQGYAQSASASAQSASGYASNAQTSANTASTKASEASTSAQTASQKATEASQSASQALSYKTDAESAKTASQTAQGLAESARDSAITAKNDAESARNDAESARDEAVQAVASISGALDDKAPVITDTASGSIASFPDGADDLPLKSLVVDINPIQDLHGQDAPWPAGGGKNLLPYATIESPLTKNGITFVRNQDGSIAVNGTSTASLAQTFVDFALQPGSYYFNCGNGFSMQPNTYAYIRDVDNSRTLAEINVNSIGIDKPFSIDVQTNVRFYMVFGQTGLVISGTLYPMIRLASVSDATYAPYENICPISGWTQVEVNHSNADMTNPTTITIPLGQTVYGGKLDVLSGVLTVDRAMVDMGTLYWMIPMDNRFYTTSLASVIKKGVDGALWIKSSMFRTVPSLNTVYNSANAMWLSNQGNISVSKIADTIAELTTAVTGQQLVYELATPITIQLTPQQVNSLLGVNNIWADSGDTEAEYRANTKLYISKKIAEAISALS